MPSKIVLDSISNLLDRGYVELQDDIYMNMNSADHLILPKGTTAQRPVNPLTGMIRWNLDTSSIDYYDNESWQEISIEEDFDELVTVGSVLFADVYDEQSFNDTNVLLSNISKYSTISIGNESVTWDAVNRGLLFTATNQRLSVTPAMMTDGIIDGSGFTYSFWVKPNSSANYGTNTYDKNLYSITDGTTNILTIGINPSGNGLYYYDNGQASATTIGSTNYNDDQWHYIAVTRNFGTGNQTATFYVDGVSIGTTNSNPTHSSGTICSIGSIYDGAAYSSTFGGLLTSIFIFERPLSAAEVLNNYNVTKYRHGL